MSTEMKYSPFVSRLKQMEEYCKNKSMNNEAKTLSSFDSITQYTMKVQVESTPQQGKPLLYKITKDNLTTNDD